MKKWASTIYEQIGSFQETHFFLLAFKKLFIELRPFIPKKSLSFIERSLCRNHTYGFGDDTFGDYTFGDQILG
jgi:hypothetical protein